MAFRFNWPDFDRAFYEKAKDQLAVALNKGEKPDNIVDRIDVKDLYLGAQPPDVEMLELSEVSEEKFRGIFRLVYNGDAYLILQTKVQVNPIKLKAPHRTPLTSPGILAAHSKLVVPLEVKISQLRLRGIVVLVVSKQKGLTFCFKNDPLLHVAINSTFDHVKNIRDDLQDKIEKQLRNLLNEDLPTILHNLPLEPKTDSSSTSSQSAFSSSSSFSSSATSASTSSSSSSSAAASSMHPTAAAGAGNGSFAPEMHMNHHHKTNGARSPVRRGLSSQNVTPTMRSRSSAPPSEFGGNNRESGSPPPPPSYHRHVGGGEERTARLYPRDYMSSSASSASSSRSDHASHISYDADSSRQRRYREQQYDHDQDYHHHDQSDFRRRYKDDADSVSVRAMSDDSPMEDRKSRGLSYRQYRKERRDLLQSPSPNHEDSDRQHSSSSSQQHQHHSRHHPSHRRHSRQGTSSDLQHTHEVQQQQRQGHQESKFLEQRQISLSTIGIQTDTDAEVSQSAPLFATLSESAPSPFIPAQAPKAEEVNATSKVRMEEATAVIASPVL